MKKLIILALSILFFNTAIAEQLESRKVPEGFTACLTPEFAHELLGAMYVKDAEYIYGMLKAKRCMQFKAGTLVSQDIDTLSPGGVMKVFIHVSSEPVDVYTHPWFMVFTKTPI